MHLKGSPSIDTQIRFSADSEVDGQHVTFTGDDRIAGFATFRLKKDYDNVRYKVLLKGTANTRTSDGKATGLQSSTHNESLTFVSATLFEGPHEATPDDSRYITNIPFKFVIQDGDLKFGVNGPSGQPRQPLPTVDSKSSPSHWSQNLKSSYDSLAQYRVTYTVIASAFVDNKKVSSKMREFDFFPTTVEPSPTPVEDFPGEYTLRSSRLLQCGTSQSRLGVISDEPPAMSLNKSGDGGWTTVKMLLMQCRETADYFAVRSPPQECRVKASLRSSTFIMPRLAKAAFHTAEVASYNKEISVREEKSNTQEFVLPLEDWESNDSESEDGKTTPASDVFTTQSHFTFILDPKQLPAPTFFSPLLSRRYAIDLTLTFDDDSASTMKLRLPVQVVYGA